jgi:hypothetical protein
VAKKTHTAKDLRYEMGHGREAVRLMIELDPAVASSDQSNFRMSSNSDGANCRPAALVTWTRHPDLNNIRALATVSVGLVISNSPVSPSFDEDILKAGLIGCAGRTAARGSAASSSTVGLSNLTLGLGILRVGIFGLLVRNGDLAAGIAAN